MALAQWTLTPKRLRAPKQVCPEALRRPVSMEPCMN
jgi:hypothetical protein